MTVLEKQRTEYRQHLDWYASVERDSWDLTQEEIIKGLGLFRGKCICDEHGNGNYALEPFMQRYLYLMFDPEQVKDVYMKLNDVQWPNQIDDITTDELHVMFLEVQEYLDVDYYNVFTEEKILTIYSTKKL